MLLLLKVELFQMDPLTVRILPASAEQTIGGTAFLQPTCTACGFTDVVAGSIPKAYRVLLDEPSSTDVTGLFLPDYICDFVPLNLLSTHWAEPPRLLIDTITVLQLRSAS